MLTRSLSTALLSIALGVGCSSSNESAAPAADGGLGDAPIDAPNAPPPADNKAFFAAAAEPICARIYSCCMTDDDRAGVLFLYGVEGTPADAASCTTVLQAKLVEFDAIVSPSVAAGRLKFVPEEAGACLAQLDRAKSSCGDFWGSDGLSSNFLACPRAYQPGVAVGGACIMPSECIDSACRPTDESRTAATCQPKGAEGDFCLGADSCAAGLVCSELVEDACIGGSKSSVCRAPGSKGARCCAADDCASGLDCFADNDDAPTCHDEVPSTPVPPTCTGVAPDAGT